MTMQAAYVPPVRTPMTFVEAESCARWVLKPEHGAAPPDNVVALLLAKSALETGRWQYIFGDNDGNVKAAPDYRGMFTCIPLNEVLGGKVVWFAPEGQLTASPANGGILVGAPIAVPDGHPQTRMRAFANHWDGWDCYVEFVKTHYAQAWARLIAGDAVGYVHALKLSHYFTADEAPYARGVVALQREFLARLRAEAPPPAVDLEWHRLQELVPHLQFDLGELIETPIGNDFAEKVA
jgi:hypothetical protein